jgi:thiol:disulfide interchange protein
MKNNRLFLLSIILLIASALGMYATSTRAHGDAGIIAPQQTTGQQIFEPVHWSFAVQDLGNDEFQLNATASIDPGWHVYAIRASNNPDAIGPVSTTLTVDKSKHINLLGGPMDGKFITHYDINFDMDLNYFEGQASFSQRFKATGAEPFYLTGSIEFMTCDDVRCLPPDIKTFNIKVVPQKAIEQGVDTSLVAAVDSLAVPAMITDSARMAMSDQFVLPGVDLENPVQNCGREKENYSLWAIFLFGLIGGLLAILTPCVFPMIPLTVTYFTKGAEKSSGKGKAWLYGFFILLIYFLLSLPFHLSKNVDPEVLNAIATNTWLNIGFFVVFIFFAVSFFGFYEIALPSGLANKVDNASNLGGVIGVFFMALTLAIVSFSCTGPILGTVIGSIYSTDVQGTVSLLGLEMAMPAAKVSAAMLGFGLALGGPFALFAMFPSLLKSLPKSGGWMDDFKVSLGFMEVALAIKFLSNADLVEQWGFLKRETFFALWILVGIAWALYMLGVYRFKQYQGTSKMSPAKWGFTIAIVAFTLRLVPGVLPASAWNRFDFLSGFPPPKFYSWYPHKHEFHIYTNLEEAKAAAIAEGKPLFLDFTGWACVNCRKMEDTVWPDEDVMKILKENYIMCSLYVDEKVELPENEQFEYTTADGRKKMIRTVGNKWATLQTETFHNNSQPFYALLSSDGRLLAPTEQYNPDVEEYREWLKCGLEANKSLPKP